MMDLGVLSGVLLQVVYVLRSLAHIYKTVLKCGNSSLNFQTLVNYHVVS